ncbi:MAG: 2OG-Fe(II) oxygenase [Vicinamibacterales bacterium]
MTDLSAINWHAIHQSLWARGWAHTGPLLGPDECVELRGLYDHDARFRTRVVMARHRFGEGEYKYFDHPLPALVRELREGSYGRLAGLANQWNDALGVKDSYPDGHPQFIEACHAQHQTRPTPLMLRYAEGGYNCLHQDLYGTVYFPFQMVVMLNQPGADYDGGHFLLVENRPRAQSAGEALRPARGHGVIFTTRTRPVRSSTEARGATAGSSRGFYRTTMRHGVSTVTRGHRFTLGIVYHDAT